MAVVKTLSNHFKYKLIQEYLDSCTIKIILMNTTFTFDKDAHATLADVTADQLATGNGYTQDSKTLANVSVSEDDANDKGVATWDDVTWTASGGSIGPTGAAIIYNDSAADDTILGCIDFGADITVPDSINFQLQDVEVDIT